ncbi:DgyrCDS1045 [Dimorphilus gyrociliatus]|uniref:DgyrCDS1045 n=1 Tax=Dimorphilus gyrociliatus TaxID=2664684 RepID=A0A7I8V6F4_9ANNE|nr:DgyrCDS1045 [Dimorphilus gyrociliatus]
MITCSLQLWMLFFSLCTFVFCNRKGFYNFCVSKDKFMPITLDCDGRAFQTGNIEQFNQVEHHPITKLILRNVGQNISIVPRKLMNSLKELIITNHTITHLRPKDVKNFSKLKYFELIKGPLMFLEKDVFKAMTNLEKLNLEENRLSEINGLRGLQNLEHLKLSSNLFTKIPNISLLKKLHTLDISSNTLRQLEKIVLSSPHVSLKNLLLKNCSISEISDLMFKDFPQLERVDLQFNMLNNIPTSIRFLQNLYYLDLSNNRITKISNNSFHNNAHLEHLSIESNVIEVMETYSLVPLINLKILSISNTKESISLPILPQNTRMTDLQVVGCELTFIPHDLCQKLPSLEKIRLHHNKIINISFVGKCTNLTTLDATRNRIKILDEKSFVNLTELLDLVLRRNLIETIDKKIFSNLRNLELLNLAENKITYIHPKAFINLAKLKKLYLEKNSLKSLSWEGLQSLSTLVASGNENLLTFPGPEKFPKLEKIKVPYVYHCCEYIKENESRIRPYFENLKNLDVAESFTYEDSDHESSLQFNHAPKNESLNDKYPEYNYRNNGEQFIPSNQFKPLIYCSPQPDVFHPCTDLLSWWALRCGSWTVFLLALLGNCAVLTVNIFGRSRMDVPRFLICNLAAADLCMGVYLGFLAVEDAFTLGEFKRYGISWQQSIACSTAGFLAVFSSELSVFTLAVITLERLYAITHAVHLNKRLSLRRATYIMVIGWIIAVIIGSLPLFGISDYRTFAVCLPFDVSDYKSKAYVCSILVLNCSAFFVILASYTKMYYSIRGSPAWNSSDSRVAKRMALLVFTDFLCWAPISFISLSATFRLNFITLEQAKILTIFVLPLNSCANPFLYAIFTKQFGKDCVQLCRRIEESSLSRSLSRLNQRHLSSSMDSKSLRRLTSASSSIRTRNPTDKSDKSTLSSQESQIKSKWLNFKSARRCWLRKFSRNKEEISLQMTRKVNNKFPLIVFQASPKSYRRTYDRHLQSENGSISYRFDVSL